MFFTSVLFLKKQTGRGAKCTPIKVYPPCGTVQYLFRGWDVVYILIQNGEKMAPLPFVKPKDSLISDVASRSESRIRSPPCSITLFVFGNFSVFFFFSFFLWFLSRIFLCVYMNWLSRSETVETIHLAKNVTSHTQLIAFHPVCRRHGREDAYPCR